MATDTLTSPVIAGGTTKTKVFRNFIDGEWVESAGGRTFEDRNAAEHARGRCALLPAVEQGTTWTQPWTRPACASRSGDSAPAPRRAETVFRAAEILIEREEDHARDMTREMGKVLAETRGDVQEAIDAAYYNAGEGRRLLDRLCRRSCPTNSPWPSASPSAFAA